MCVCMRACVHACARSYQMKVSLTLFVCVCVCVCVRVFGLCLLCFCEIAIFPHGSLLF